jgi:C-terminal processing protease CtpA/Prc
MTENALARLYIDLNSETYQLDGVVVDVRNNNGGFVNGYASDVFARRNYISLKERGFPAATGRVALGQRFLGLPTILLTNRHTLSDGEDFTEGYQAQNLGKTVGEPTAGWIIFTDTIRLLDGTTFRVPTSTVTDHNGQVMEMHPRHVDVPVLRPVGESYSGQDIQLKTATNELMGQIEDARDDAMLERILDDVLASNTGQSTAGTR